MRWQDGPVSSPWQPKSLAPGGVTPSSKLKRGLLNIKLIVIYPFAHLTVLEWVLDFRERRIRAQTFDTHGVVPQAAAPSSHTVTRHCTAPTTGDNEPVMAAYLYPDAVPYRTPSPKVSASPLPRSISEPPGRLVRDGCAPLVQNLCAEWVWGHHHDPLRD